MTVACILYYWKLTQAAVAEIAVHLKQKITGDPAGEMMILKRGK